MNYTPYKNRTINPYKVVEVYRCLNHNNQNIYAIRQNSFIVGHTIEGVAFNLRHCMFGVIPSSTDRCQTDSRRKVHTFIEGKVTPAVRQCTELIEYDPHSKIGFVHNGQPISTARYVSITSDGIYI